MTPIRFDALPLFVSENMKSVFASAEVRASPHQGLRPAAWSWRTPPGGRRARSSRRGRAAAPRPRSRTWPIREEHCGHVTGRPAVIGRCRVPGVAPVGHVDERLEEAGLLLRGRGGHRGWAGGGGLGSRGRREGEGAEQQHTRHDGQEDEAAQQLGDSIFFILCISKLDIPLLFAPSVSPRDC